MASFLLYDQRLWGSPPSRQVNAACLVDASHPMTSIVNWLKVKCDAYPGYHRVYIMAHGADGMLQLGKDNFNKSNVHLWGPLSPKVEDIVIFGCNVAKSYAGWEFTSRLAKQVRAWVVAADSTPKYVALPAGILPTTFGNWEGTVYVWGPNGVVAGSWTDWEYQGEAEGATF